MKLGELVRLQLTTTDVSLSLLFYERLGFKRFDEPLANSHCILLSDGIIVLSLCQATDGAERHPTLTYFSPKINEQITLLTQLGVAVSVAADAQAHFTSPEGMPVRLVSRNTAAMYRPEGVARSGCGRFYELSFETESLRRSIAYWRHIGFEVESNESAQATFATLYDGVLRLGVYQRGTCPHKFKNPSLTYFEPDMSERIKQLKVNGVKTLEELPDQHSKIENAIIESPEGQYFFLFHYDW
ncbi:MAG: hypothetical protein WKG07_39910 [Hymenobacter sp.]